MPTDEPDRDLERVALHFTDGSTQDLTPENAQVYFLNRRFNHRLGEEDPEEWLKHTSNEHSGDL